VFTARYGLDILTIIKLHLIRLSPPRPRFDARPIRVKFVVRNVALEQVFLRIHLFSPVRAISPKLLIRMHFKSTLARTENGPYLEI
jgi:hypothetical protein